jgi:hypothetical protein
MSWLPDYDFGHGSNRHQLFATALSDAGARDRLERDALTLSILGQNVSFKAVLSGLT